MILNKPYNKELFDIFLKDFLPDYQKDERQVRTPDKSILTEVTQLGASRDVNVTVLEAECEEIDTNKRIAITQAAFKVLRDHGIRNAIIAFHDGADQWRLSLLTSTLDIKDGKVIKKDSNPRRYSYLVGVGAKTVTPYKYLIEKGKVADIKQLQERFSVEVVNKQFYASIAELFTKLIGGERGATKYPGLLKLNGSVDQNIKHQEFAVRLIGRVIFSWFLKEKKSTAGIPIVPNELLSLDAVASNADYYHSILEPLFFELLNKRVEQRHENLREAPFSTVPYLNGGLFSPQYNDFYNQSSYNGAGTPGLTHIPDTWFTELFTVLEQYNFTVDENTSYDVDLSIDPEMLGRIFENLLAEINPETGESARKSTGSFYTPREIVDYMVDSSLLEFLKSKTSADEDKLKALISWGQSDDEEYPLTDGEKEKVVHALAGLTILDPACGSGAFPIGILQKVVYILQQADPKAEIWLENQLKNIASPELKRDIQEKYESENYDWLRKYGVIRETIFGIDIQTIATEISKLRCFLTLIIEEEVNDDFEHNRGVHALPNLDFKFVTANSLVSLPDGNSNIKGKGLNLFEDVTHIEQLKRIRNQYFGANADERARLQVEFKNLQMDMLRSRIATSGATSDLYNTLSDWDPFSHKATDWFDSEWMFGVDGFDIVIANPPYLGEKSHKSMFDKLKQTELGRKFYKGKMDLFYLFFHLGLNNIDDGGILSFISTNYYPTADGALKLRKDFHERTNVIELINFNEYKIFESALGQHNMITLLQKSITPNIQHLTKQTLVKKRGGPDANELNSFLRRTSEDASYTTVDKTLLFDSSNYYIRFPNVNSEITSALYKIAQSKNTLGTYCDINQGLKTNADKFTNKHIINTNITGSVGDGIFVINNDELKKIKPSEKDTAYIKPFFKNSDISRYLCKRVQDHYVLYITNEDYIEENSNLVVNHLAKYNDVLRARAEIEPEGRIKIYSITRPRRLDMFLGEKIVCPLWAKSNTFGYSEGAWFAATDVTFITSKKNTPESPKLKSILAILNSKLILIWLQNKGKRKGDLIELPPRPLSEIPIPSMNEQDQYSLVALADNIITCRSENPNADTSAQEAAINQIVYGLYNLTPEEIAIVEGSVA